ncbi:MAG: reverse transcriptase [Candidatus Lokiarchaeota archaeon]|nr:reverse transcriptase [Candidatus Lokiarchaeota archaeon]
MKLSENALEWSLRHFEKVGYINHFPIPFELGVIKYDWENIKNFILGLKLPVDWKIQEARKIFAPKHYFGFRLLTQLNPIDELIYSSVIYDMGKDLERYRVSKDKEIVFSNRFLPSAEGDLWDKNYVYGDFEEKTKELVDSDKYSHIVVADIADYFPRIYLHKLENALSIATKKTENIKSIMKLIKHLNQNISIGIPIGSEVSFLLADTMISSIDKRLIDENVTFCRFVDDFRLFCKNKSEAYKALNFLSEILYNDLSLTLQQNKTRIFEVDNYKKIKFDKKSEKKLISKEFSEFIKKDLKLENPYSPIDVESLSIELKKKLESFNFDEIIKEQIVEGKIDINLVKIALNRLKQTNNPESVEDILENLEEFYPILNEAISYILSIEDFDPTFKNKIGTKIIDYLENSFISHSIFNRMWLLHIFSKNNDYGGEDKFIKYFKKYSDEFSRRELILAMGRAKKYHWFTSERKKFPGNLTSWQRRAFLAACSCGPTDEVKHWYNYIFKHQNLTKLDKAVIKWVKRNPF